MQQGMERWVCRSGNFAKAVCSDTAFSRQLHFPPSLVTLQRAASARQGAAVEETCIRAPDRTQIISATTQIVGSMPGTPPQSEFMQSSDHVHLNELKCALSCTHLLIG